MRAVIQLVKNASCTIDGELVSSIEKGYCILVGFNEQDSKEIVDKMIAKIVKLRIFMDENEKMNLSIQDVGGSVLSISQFTLYANCKKGNRPSFIEAAKPSISSPLYDYFNEALSKFVPVQTGVFGADMKIDLCNDGPITIVLDSENL
ncbi:D-aminoacyl-tRNA deacylase [Floccifex sp.]|uniref:D-aminoacyl-tRNA deacylase n=1 Tax=Floccifex sp. TaxID=2815810 RepID=UPI002A75E397|nr:D-aminoacyl-tRNA deacylase [Floccifex sp.]MDD7280611.1 D-aminoacyl-tRNA deacylase [Erysipelotrichaceae bacterium]MDY2958862.1 D-aminoacyl-tRNA deacylase [Floccifex sp.]